MDPNEVETIVVTDLHGDHFGGLPFLILDGQFRRRTRDLFRCEGYGPTPVKWHLDLETLDEHRDRFTCRDLVLTHLSPDSPGS